MSEETKPLTPIQVSEIIGPQPLEEGDVLFTLPKDAPPVWYRQWVENAGLMVAFVSSWTKPIGDDWKLVPDETDDD